MIRSMTGFGRGEATVGELTVVAEARSVNNRFLDVGLRLPREHAAFEPAVQRRVREAFRRGRVELTVRRQAAAGAPTVRADAEVFAAWSRAVEPLLVGRSDAERAAVLPVLLGQPGVLVASGLDVAPEVEQAALDQAVGQALTALAAMREAEGVLLDLDLRGLLDGLEADVEACAAQTADVAARLAARIEERVVRLVGEGVERWRIAQEAALLADRADVAEELTRLRAHLDQARGALASDEAVGRRLDFLVQEMLREVNTLGSKTVDAPVSHRVVAMKTALERLREQAANVE